MKKTAEGEISLRGKWLSYEGIDLDYMLEKYKKSQNFNLIDIGSDILESPLPQWEDIKEGVGKFVPLPNSD